MRTFAILIATCFFHVSLFAQEVEFNIPTGIDIIQGQLSVVFKDNVDQEKALQIIEEFGYDTLSVHFSPVVVDAQIEKPISKKILQQIKANTEIWEINQQLIPRTIPGDLDQTPNDLPTEARINVTFKEGTPHKKVLKLLKKYVTLLSFNVNSLPNEMIIDVGEQDEKAFELLQENKHIKRVSYIGASEEF